MDDLEKKYPTKGVNRIYYYLNFGSKWREGKKEKKRDTEREMERGKAEEKKRKNSPQEFLTTNLHLREFWVRIQTTCMTQKTFKPKMEFKVVSDRQCPQPPRKTKCTSHLKEWIFKPGLKSYRQNSQSKITQNNRKETTTSESWQKQQTTDRSSSSCIISVSTVA